MQVTGCERFATDLDGDGTADAAVWGTQDGWHVGFSNGREFGKPYVLHVFTMECLAGDKNCIQRVVSEDLLWYVTTSENASVWHPYNVSAKRAGGEPGGDPVHLTDPGAPYVPPLKQLLVDDVTNDTRADLVALDSGGNIFVAKQQTNGSFAPFRLGFANFSAAAHGCLPGPLLLSPSSATTTEFLQQHGGGSAMVACAGNTGYWYVGGINIEANEEQPVSVWKYSHGGDMGGAKAPRTEGWPQDGKSNAQHFRYADFKLARMCPGCAPSPLACNTTTQEGGESPRCCVLPAEQAATATNGFDKLGFELKAPALKSTNANLWEAWHLNFMPELKDGSFGGYDSADLVQARYMFQKLSSVGVDFYMSDNTNGLGCDFGNTYAATKALAALSARMNAEGGAKLYYGLMIGVNPLGGPSAPGIMAKMEAQLLSVYNTFLNTTDAAAAAIDGNGGAGGANAAALAAAAWRHPISKKPAVVLYVEPIFEQMWDDYVKKTPTSIGHTFHVGYSDGNGWRDGLWGWMIDRSCGPPNTFASACNETDNVSTPIRTSNDTMYISPGYAKGSQPTHTKVYAARSIKWYKQQWPVAAKQCPAQLIVGAFNDYSEMNGWWPSQCPDCATGEEHDPYLFWNATVAGLASVRAACGQ